MPRFIDQSDIDQISKRIGGGGGGSTDYTTLSNKPQINGIELLGNKSANDLHLIGDLGTAPDAGPYRLPYFFKTTPAADKITVTAETISLDNAKTKAEFSLDVPAATESTAGLMSAADKTTLNNVLQNSKNYTDTKVATKQDKLNEIQEAAINSGIDSIKVEVYNSYRNDIDGKMNLLPKAPDAGPYRLPYFFKTTPAADKITVTAETISLDNNNTKAEFSLDVPAATVTAAGLMSAADKVKLNSVDSGYQPDNDTIALNDDNKLKVKDSSITYTQLNSSLVSTSLPSEDPSTTKLTAESAVVNGLIPKIQFLTVTDFPARGQENIIYAKEYYGATGWKRYEIKNEYLSRYDVRKDGIYDYNTSTLNTWADVSAESDTKWVGNGDTFPIAPTIIPDGRIVYGPDGSGPVTGTHAMTYYSNVIGYEYKFWRDGDWYTLGNVRQCTVLPMASAEYSGAIMQYMGKSDVLINLDYGHFYQCVQSDGAWIWKEFSFTNVSSADGNALVVKNDGLYSAGSNPYVYMKQLADYLYEIQFTTENMDLEYAYNYFTRPATATYAPAGGGCTGVYFDRKVLRQYDWYYDNEVEFLVRRTADKEHGKYASIGVASALPIFTNDTVGKGLYDERYKLVPYVTCDGVNEKGVFIQQNVTPKKAADINVVHTCSAAEYKGKITVNMIGRIVLDNCASADDVIPELQKYDIVRPTKLPAQYDGHYLIADASGRHFVLEFSQDGTSLKKVSNVTGYDGDLITNFNCDAPDGIILDELALDWDKISADNEGNAGLERWEICANAMHTAVSTGAQLDLNALMEDLMYTNMYTKSDAPKFKWLTEYCGEDDPRGGKLSPAKAKSAPASFDQIYEQGITDYNSRVRGDGKGWQSVHAAIYDLRTRSMKLVIQERLDSPMEFKLNEAQLTRTEDSFQFDINEGADWGTKVNIVDKLVAVSIIFNVDSTASGLVDDQSVFHNLPEAASTTYGFIGCANAGNRIYIEENSTRIKTEKALTAGGKYAGTLIYRMK